MSDLENEPAPSNQPVAEHGGARAGGGRRIRGQNRDKVSAGELRDKLLRTGETPLEVMIDGMRRARAQHARIGKKLDAFDLDTLSDPDAMKELRALIGAASGYLAQAHECAKDAAPYLHPRVEAMGRFLDLDLPQIKSATDIVTAQGVVIDALSDGELTADEAAKVAGILESRRKAIETVELEKRIAALEERPR